MKIDRWCKIVQSAIVGPRCVLCRAPAPLDPAICSGCRAELPWLDRACAGCALPLPGDAQTTHCRHCRPTPRFEHAVAAFHYDEPARWLIARLKFNGALAHARVLGDLLGTRIAGATPESERPDALVPVPLHPAGLRRRGFNQATLIAERLAQALDRPVTPRAAARVRDTPPQRELPAGSRAANVRGAFACRGPSPAAHVAIVDDVVTTTRTAAALADALRRAGAQRITLYCVARA
ncbi:amidophosphoribosyltransferase [Salinisphaera orenii MK-B5]|uniref:Amidophosphoribosyltransferase n=1 Tax=Salinisphaera orenii MK-B5 TaxID=856730 RepID=A0A423PQE9_9GAMM|nr:ComF family protein [Salinisphaera orenii]ROO27820.1 amidophosphoribosyltransferase [Salinisphaera orenii MK-B5]